MAVDNFTGNGLQGSAGPGGDLQGYLWFDSGNWDNNVPQAGDAVTIGSFQASILLGDAGLSSMTVTIGNDFLFGNVLSLSGVQMTSTSLTQLFFTKLTVNKTSFVGISSPQFTQGGNGFYLIGENAFGSFSGTGTLNNMGTIGSTAVGDTVIQQALIDNKGTLIASNGGTLDLSDSQVYTDRGIGKIQLANSGTVDLQGGVVLQSSEQIRFIGEAASELTYDPASNTVNAAILNFRATDLLELQNFQASAISQSGPVNPSVTLTDSSGVSHSLQFSGNYTNNTFSFQQDANGSGTVLTVSG